MKEKANISKLISIVIITLSVCIFTAFPASAKSYETDNAENADMSLENYDIEANFEENVENDIHSDEIIDTAVDNQAQKSDINTENIFEDIYNKLCTYSTEILSFLTLIGTLIVGFAYKKGLLPLVTRAVSAIQGSVNKIKQDTEEGARSTVSSVDNLTERLAAVENSLAFLSEDISTLSSKLECESECIKERKKMKTVLTSQVDMLYDIFMASALPQYQKDATGTRIQAMREEINSYESDEKQ